MLLIWTLSGTLQQGFRSLKFEPLDPDLLGTDPPENDLKFK